MKPRQLLSTRFPFASAIVALLAAPTASAVVWIGASNGNWGNGANWASGSVPGAGSLIEFNSTSGSVTSIYISAARNVSGINFLSGNPVAQRIGLSTQPNNTGTAVNLTFTASTTGITVNDGRDHTVGSLGQGASGDIILLGNLPIATTSGNLTINQPITGSTFGISKSGAGTLTLTGANLYSGTTTLTAGTINLGVAETVDVSGPLGKQLATAAGTIVLNGGTLQYSASNNNDYSGRFSTAASQNYNVDTNGVNVAWATDLTSTGGSLTKSGATTLTLSGTNTFTGATIINAGVLALANANALQNTSGITIGGASAATLSSTITGITIAAPITTANTGVTSTISFATSSGGSFTLDEAIGGNGNVAYTTPNVSSGGNTNTINLGAAGTYAGSTTINTGNSNNNLVLRNASAAANVLPTSTVLTFGTGAGTTTSARTTTFDLNGQNQTLAGLGSLAAVAVPNGRNHRVTSTAAATLTINSTADQIFGGTTLTAQPLTTSAQITGAISLVKNGVGIFTLGGLLTGGATASGNSFTGSTTVLGGILVLGETRSIQNSAFDTTASITGNATNGLRTTVPTLTLGGLTGGNDFSTRFTSSTGGYTGLTALTLNPGTGVTHNYAGDIGDGATGMNLAKTGAGTQVLTGTNNLTGTTSVSAGKLVVEGSIAASAVSVSGTGTILASGASATVGNSLLIQSGAILAVGDAGNATTATATVTNATTFNNNSIFSWDINAAGTSYDKLVTTNVLGEGAAGDAVFRIVAADATFANTFWDIDRTWTDIFTTNGSSAISGWASVFGNTVSVVNSSFTTITPVDGAFSLSGSTLTWTAVPEPTSAFAGLLLATGLMRRWRA